MIAQLGNLLLSFMPRIVSILLGLQKLCYAMRGFELASHVQERFKTINKTIMKRFEQIFDKFQDLQGIESFTETFLAINQEKIEKLYLEAIDSESGLLKLFKIWANVDVYRSFFSQTLVNHLVKIYGQTK